MVPPTSLSVSCDAVTLVKDMDSAQAINGHAVIGRLRVAVVDAEVVAGDLLVAAALRLGIEQIRVIQDYGDAFDVRQRYSEAGSTHGVEADFRGFNPQSG